jgi:hypothetical protein
MNPFIIMPLVTTFLCDTSELWFKHVDSHIPYKPLQDCDYRQMFFTK